MNLDVNPGNPKESQRTPSRSRSRLQTNRTRGLQSRLSALGERSAEFNERGEHIWCVSNLILIKNGRLPRVALIIMASPILSNKILVHFLTFSDLYDLPPSPPPPPSPGNENFSWTTWTSDLARMSYCCEIMLNPRPGVFLFFFLFFLSWFDNRSGCFQAFLQRLVSMTES